MTCGVCGGDYQLGEMASSSVCIACLQDTMPDLEL